MAAVLICSQTDLTRALAPTLIGRGGIDRFKATRIDEARLLAKTTCPKVILVDRDLPKAKDLIQWLREEPSTRFRSLAVLAHGDFQPLEIELLASGANAILRMPPGRGWDDRLSRLLTVPARQDARLPVELAVDAGAHGDGAQALNVSVGGMLLHTTLPLRLHHEFGFSFRLPDGATVAGRARVMRQPAPNQYGVEFLSVDAASIEAIRQFVRSAQQG